MEIEDTDSIEKEFDIVYSGHFSNDAKIFQFPLIPKDSLNIENIHSLSISENLKNMKMEMKVDDKYLDKNNYNAIPFQNLKGEKIENNSNLCLGIIKNNKLILTPISQIFQFRHDFSDINKEKSISLKIKKEKKDTKNIGIKKEEKEEIKYNNLSLYFPQSIDSKIALQKMTDLEGDINKANIMTKDEYFNFLLKYVITPDSEIDTNDDFLSLYKNNFSNSYLENVKEEEEDIIKKEKKSTKKSKGFNSGIDAIKKVNNEKKVENSSIVRNIITLYFNYNKYLIHTYNNIKNIFIVILK